MIFTPKLLEQARRLRTQQALESAPLPQAPKPRETRQMRRQRDRLTHKVQSSPEVASRPLGKSGLREFKVLASQIRNEGHLQEILRGIQDDDVRKRFLEQVTPYLRFKRPLAN